jgi:hypothetical protein
MISPFHVQHLARKLLYVTEVHDKSFDNKALTFTYAVRIRAMS